MINDETWEKMESDQELMHNFERITIESLREFTKGAVREFGTEDKLGFANKVTDAFYDLMKHRGQITENNEQSFVNVYIVAGLLHNLFYDGTVTSLFKAREVLWEAATKDAKIPFNYAEKIFDAIEAQLGDKTPVAKCRPIPSHPEGDFALCCWFFAKDLEQ